MNNIRTYINYLNKWIFDYCHNSKTNGIILGISGGVDSAVVGAIASLNKKNRVIGVWMNIDNSPLDLQCLQELKKQKRFPIIECNLLPLFEQYKQNLNITNAVAMSNLKARIRMTALYAYAQQNNLLVAGTSNADELYMGYFTKYGDGGCDIMPIAHLNKSQVYECAKTLKLPSNIIDRAPTASLYIGQTDEKEMGITYNTIDNFLLRKRINQKSLKIIEAFHSKNQHKFNLPVKPDKEFKQ